LGIAQQARIRPVALSSSVRVNLEYSNRSTEPEISLDLQVPQVPEWQENGKGTFCTRAASTMVSSSPTENRAEISGTVTVKDITFAADPKRTRPKAGESTPQ
jgi:hypothetical protein